MVVRPIVKKIQDVYSEFTNIEKRIADFFINNEENIPLSSKSIAQRLFISEASLSRFSKKCGFKGYREFVYEYEQHINNYSIHISALSSRVMHIYEEIQRKSQELIDEEQIERISELLNGSKRIYVYGKGSSGCTAQEFSVRFMRMGLHIEAITDTHIMLMNAALADSDVLVMGISLSGTTKEVNAALCNAKRHGAKVILMTANAESEMRMICDEVLLVANVKKLEEGTMISPQVPILMMIDIMFTCYFSKDLKKRLSKFEETLFALDIITGS